MRKAFSSKKGVTMIEYVVLGKKKTKRGNNLDYKIRKNDLSFIFLTQPSDDEIDKICKDFKLKKKTFYNYTKEQYSMRYGIKPFQFVMIDYFMEKSKLECAHLFFVLMNNCMIIVSNKNAEYYNDLFDEIAEDLKKNPVKGIGHLLYLFLQQDIEDNYDALENIEEEIGAIERNISKCNDKVTVDTKDVVKLKRKLFRMSRQFWASAKIISSIRRGVSGIKINRDSSLLLGDIHETFMHQIDMASTQREMLTDLLEVHSANTSNELNKIMKKLAAFALIIMIPTFITGVYGMNFDFMPMTVQYYGFYFTLGLMLFITLILVQYFKKKDWL
ncbi:MAG: hypothetical protein GY861_09030 [bacterium]|nr:hypothetical protein [bacterium]